MATELEWKFAATESGFAALEKCYKEVLSPIRMETTYFDTPDQSLSARRWTLRRRLENGVSVCTVKTPAGSARGEWEVEAPSIEEAIPRLLALGCPAELAELVREGLVPTCGARFTRRCATVTLPGGTVELALDQGVLLGCDREIPLWEAEVELKDGSQAVCDGFADRLAARFALEPEPLSKFARAASRR